VSLGVVDSVTNSFYINMLGELEPCHCPH
jgi:hypothetical protein